MGDLKLQHRPHKVSGTKYLAIDIDPEGLLVVSGPAGSRGARVEHAYSWLMQELRDLQHDGASWPAEKIGLFADSLIAYCDAHQIGTRAALAKADGKEAL